MLNMVDYGVFIPISNAAKSVCPGESDGAVHEGGDVGLFFDHLCRRLSASVTRFRVDPNHQRVFLNGINNGLFSMIYY